jgi:hypothetical protein
MAPSLENRGANHTAACQPSQDQRGWLRHDGNRSGQPIDARVRRSQTAELAKFVAVSHPSATWANALLNNNRDGTFDDIPERCGSVRTWRSTTDGTSVSIREIKFDWPAAPPHTVAQRPMGSGLARPDRLQSRANDTERRVGKAQTHLAADVQPASDVLELR